MAGSGGVRLDRLPARRQRLAMLARETGQLWWGRDLSSHRGLAADSETLYVTTADSTIVALRRRDGTPVWSHGSGAGR